MDFKKRLKTRLNVAFIYIAIGIMSIVASFIMKTDNYFISSWGIALVVIGIARIKKHCIITKSEDSIRNQQIIETDERNITIVHKARSAAFLIYILLSGLVVIVLGFLNIMEVAKWISYSVCLLIVIYWVCYFIYQKKL